MATTSFRDLIDQVRYSLADSLQHLQPGPKTFAVAWCIGATIGQFAAQAGLEGLSAAIATLSAQLGVNLLADIIGDRKPPPSLTVEEIADAVQQRLERGDDLPARASCSKNLARCKWPSTSGSGARINAGSN